MASPRGRYDFLVKMLLIGDSAVGKSALLLRFSEDSFPTDYVTTIGIDFKMRTVQLKQKRVKLQIWDTAGQERFRTITTAYYRGASAILLVYDCTERSSFENVKSWMGQIEKHASPGVVKLLIANKCDINPSERTVSKVEGEKLAEEYGMPFFETSAKDSINVEEAFFHGAEIVLDKLMKQTDKRKNAPKEPVDLETEEQSSGCCS